MSLPQPLPDNPMRWEGWRDYNSDNPYRRLCLDFDSNPSPEQIEENCRQLLVWWQKKLPLKSQPSNPITQLLRNALDDAPGYLAEARAVLLDASQRAKIDDRLRAELKAVAMAEFEKYLAFALASGGLTEEDEENLYRVGGTSGLGREELKVAIDAGLERTGAKRIEKAPPPPANVPTIAPYVAGAEGVAVKCLPGNPAAEEFMRLLKLSKLSEEDMTDDQRDALCNMGESLGLTGGQSEDVIDEYLEMMSDLPVVIPAASMARAKAPVRPQPAKSESAPAAPAINTSPLARAQEKAKYPNFTNAAGLEMLLVTSGTFIMGSNALDAAPNEQPLSRTTVSCFFMARFPITNAQYEVFDPRHHVMRMRGAGDNYPVVQVSSLEAMKYCEWLSARERRKYRLPTEAEWELAARGMEGRIFPWGEKLNRGDLANFADANTTFAWRDPVINDGYAETSPVGAYARGASPFGIEDMAGNVWEWCLDFYAPYPGKDRVNPRTATTGSRRIYRGGSWKSRIASLRTTARSFNVPSFSASDVGFRVVCEVEA